MPVVRIGSSLYVLKFICLFWNLGFTFNLCKSFDGKMFTCAPVSNLDGISVPFTSVHAIHSSLLFVSLSATVSIKHTVPSLLSEHSFTICTFFFVKHFQVIFSATFTTVPSICWTFPGCMSRATPFSLFSLLYFYYDSKKVGMLCRM